MGFWDFLIGLIVDAITWSWSWELILGVSVLLIFGVGSFFLFTRLGWSTLVCSGASIILTVLFLILLMSFFG